MHSTFRVRRQSQTWSTPSAPINRLPNELVEDIFHHLTSYDPSIIPTLLLVCRHWNRIATSYPKLWAKILIRGPFDDLRRTKLEKMVLVHYNLSRNYLLDIDFDSNTTYADESNDREHQYRLSVSTLIFLEYLFQMGTRRWKSFRYAYPRNNGSSLPHWSIEESKEGDLTALEELTLIGQRDGGEWLCLPSMPNLQTLRLSQIRWPFDTTTLEPIFPSSIHVLDLHWNTGYEWKRHMNVVGKHWLSNYPHLTHLTLRVGRMNAPSRKSDETYPLEDQLNNSAGLCLTLVGILPWDVLKTLPFSHVYQLVLEGGSSGDRLLGYLLRTEPNYALECLSLGRLKNPNSSWSFGQFIRAIRDTMGLKRVFISIKSSQDILTRILPTTCIQEAQSLGIETCILEEDLVSFFRTTHFTPNEGSQGIAVYIDSIERCMRCTLMDELKDSES